MEEKIKQLKKQLRNIYNELDKLIHTNEEENKIDFSQWIGRHSENLCIFGKNKMLKSLNYIDEINIAYNNMMRELYDKPINYEVIEQKDLKHGDVFIQDMIKNPKTYDFNIYLGKNYDHVFIQYLDEFDDYEVVNYTYFHVNPNEKVKRFLRE